MSCPTGNCPQISQTAGSAGVVAQIRAQRRRKRSGQPQIERGRFHYRKLEEGEQPVPGRAYILIRSSGAKRPGVLHSIQKVGYHPALKKDQYRVYFTAMEYTSLEDDTEWYEREEQPTPDWEAHPTQANRDNVVAFFTNLTRPVLAQIADDLYRCEMIDGSFLLIWHDPETKLYVTVPFTPDGVRIAGTSFAAKSVKSALNNTKSWLRALVYPITDDAKKTFNNPGLNRSRERGAVQAEKCNAVFTSERSRLEMALKRGESFPLETLVKYPDLLARYGGFE